MDVEQAYNSWKVKKLYKVSKEMLKHVKESVVYYEKLGDKLEAERDYIAALEAWNKAEDYKDFQQWIERYT